MKIALRKKKKKVFRADARSRAAYESFGDVISFDITNLTNFATEKQFQDS